MSTPSVEARYRLGQLVDSMQALHDAAELRPNRKMTRSEQISYDKLSAAAQVQRAEIARLEEREGRVATRADISPDMPIAIREMIMEQTRHQHGLADPLSGTAILAPHQSLAAALRGGWDPDVPAEALRLDRWLAGVITGDWSRSQLEYRAMGESTMSTGGWLVPAPLSVRILDLVRAQSVAFKAGALIIPMESATLTIARQLSDGSPVWHAENVSDVTAGDITVGAVELSAKTLAVMVKSSIELYEDANPMVEDLIQRSIAASLALELDRAVLFGQSNGVGSSEPLGAANWPGVVSTSVGTNITVNAVLDSLARLWANNMEANGLVWSPAIRRTWAGLLTGEGLPLVENLQPDVRDLAKYSSTQTPSGVVLVGDFSRLLVGLRTSLVIEATRVGVDNNTSAWSSMQVLVRGYLRCDAVVTHPNGFDVLTGVS